MVPAPSARWSPLVRVQVIMLTAIISRHAQQLGKARKAAVAAGQNPQRQLDGIVLDQTCPDQLLGTDVDRQQLTEVLRFVRAGDVWSPCPHRPRHRPGHRPRHDGEHPSGHRCPRRPRFQPDRRRRRAAPAGAVRGHLPARRRHPTPWATCTPARGSAAGSRATVVYQAAAHLYGPAG